MNSFKGEGDYMTNIKNYSEQTFESIKHMDNQGEEYWYARELQHILEYAEWRNFEKVIQKAKIACEKAKNVEKHNFVEVNKTVSTGIGQEKYIKDIMLSRYACYLIVQNGDPSKEVRNLLQIYFV